MLNDSTGSREMTNETSSREITVTPSECSNERLGKESSVPVDHSKANESSLSAKRTRAGILTMSGSEGPLTESSSVAPAAFHPRTSSKAARLFSSKEFMFLSLADSDGLRDGYRLHRVHFGELPELPNKLRVIADELEALSM